MKISTDKLIAHVGCGTVDDVGCCVFCELIRGRLRSADTTKRDLRAALEVPMAYWRAHFASHGGQHWTVDDEFWRQWLDSYGHLMPEPAQSDDAVDPHLGISND